MLKTSGIYAPLQYSRRVYLGLATLGLERVHGQHREPEAGLQWQRRELAQVFGLVVTDLK